jgi:tetratricopeptide (TPR) repeat protein
MAAADPYAPCPCGSGQKFKWCCQKVEALADRAQRLIESGQLQGAIEALDEGLRKEPDSPLLLIRKAAYLAHRGALEAAREPLRRLVQKQPGHAAGQSLLTRLVLETEGPLAGAAQFQRALAGVERANWPLLGDVFGIVAGFLADAGLYQAALRHLELGAPFATGRADRTASLRPAIETNPTIPAWQKNAYRLSEPPESLPAEAWGRFAQALGWAREGLWNAAAAAFELLAAGGKVPEADRNLGLCRLWTGDHAAAVPALRRWVKRAGVTPEAVDIEALCQEIAPPGPDDTVEQVQLSWSLRDRERLLETLRADPMVHPEGTAPADPNAEDSPEVDQFALLDRSPIAARRGLNVAEIPRYQGRVLVGPETVALEAFDDGRLNALSARFTTLAGTAIAPAHPRSKVMAKVLRTGLALSWESLFPEGLEHDEIDRLVREHGAATVRDVWPVTPMPYLGGRTPAAAAAAGNAEVPLRAALFQLELAPEPWRDGFDFAALRAKLGVGPEAAVDPDTVDLNLLHVARLNLVPVERLSDARLVEFYGRARSSMQLDATERAALRLVENPSVAVVAKIESRVIYSDLIAVCSSRGQVARALEWLRRGRQADPASARASNAPYWDMLEIRLRSRVDPPESWVAELAVVLQRHGNDKVANEKVVMALIDMGLMRLVARAERPEEVFLDASPLQALMEAYGPRITTASGELGVAASRGQLWTPGSEPGGSGGALWTPGSGSSAGSSAPPAAGAAPAPPGGERPRLIIPGR